MLKEWSDDLPDKQAADLWNTAIEREVLRRLARIEAELRGVIDRKAIASDFYHTMRKVIALRERLLPAFPVDPAWKILMTLAQTPAGSDKSSGTSIAYGAEVPLTTALRYIAALELEGIVARSPHPDDRRQVVIALTEEGRKRLESIAERWSDHKILLMIVMPLVILMTTLGSLILL